MTQKRQSKRTLIFSLFCLFIVLFTGGLTLSSQMQQRQSGQAKNQNAVGNIVGPPTLSGTTVDTIFTQMGSPMVGMGSVVEQASRQTNIDDAFALGVWWTETNDGAAGVGRADRNPGSVRGSYGYPSAYDGYTIYPSYVAAINDWFNVLKSRYVSRGLSSVYSLCYSYVGTSSAPLWAAKVVNLMYRYRGIAPPPQVIATATPKPQQTATTSAVSSSSSNTIHRHQLARIAKLLDNGITPGDRGAILSSQHQQSAVRDILQSTPNRSPSLPELPLVCFGLLAALAIALAGLRIGRKTTNASFMMTVETTNKVENMMRRSLKADRNTGTLSASSQFIVSSTQVASQYSPITEALSPSFAQGSEQVLQLDFPPYPGIYQPLRPQHISLATWQNTPLPTNSVESSGISEHQLPIPIAMNRAGLLKRYTQQQEWGEREKNSVNTR